MSTEIINMPHNSVMGAEFILPEHGWSEASDQEELFAEDEIDDAEVPA
jgi:hypothetical protein